ncbi:ROK family protein [Nonomuraea soli]|uniref:Glucokinase n=1 Tax=Nonomuraea soli TaxID=1032476 RepID=A0A7W0CPA7_9ACTN|nr:ROK family protein [Nonomuraea soli]MBA2894826.1 glucokinase [Nonomuraea soli]
MKSVIAIDVGGTTMKGGLVAEDGRLLHEERRPTPRADGPERVIAEISRFAAGLQALAASPVAVGLAVPGLVTATHAVYSAAIGWRDVPKAAFTATELPVALGHDVRAAGEAELAFGGGDGEVLYLPIGTGIAGAVVLGGVPYGGAGGWAGQIGHIPVRPDGLACSCGQRGCLGAYASASAVARAYGVESAARVVEAAAAGEPRAVRIWEQAVEALAVALATYTLLLDPRRIVIGGGLSLAGEHLLAPLRERLAARLTFRAAPELAASTLGTRAGLLGAGLLGWRYIAAVTT